MLAENLNRQNSKNEVDMVLSSKIFANTFFIKYKSDINISEIMKNFDQHCAVSHKTKMKLFQVESTRALLIRPLYNFLPEHYAFGKLGGKMYQNEDLRIIKFDSDENLLESLIELESSLDSNEYVLEELYSKELLDMPTIENSFDVQKYGWSSRSLAISNQMFVLLKLL